MHALRRPELYSSSSYDRACAHVIGNSIIGMDEPEHRRMRLLLQPAFTKVEMERWKGEIIQPIVDEHLDRIVGARQAPISTRRSRRRCPVHTISAALGLPTEDRKQFFDWAVGMTSMAAGADASFGSVERGRGVHRAAHRRPPRRAPPTTSSRSSCEATRPTRRGPRRPRPSARSTTTRSATFVQLLIIAGAGTTYRAYGNLMFFLLTHPDQFAAVRDDRSLVPAAIEESLRVEQPLAQILRVATEDSELARRGDPGRVLGAGQRRCREPRSCAVGEDPETFDIFRDRPDRHLSFGFGIHRCLGIHLARAELEVLLNRTTRPAPEPSPRSRRAATCT